MGWAIGALILGVLVGGYVGMSLAQSALKGPLENLGLQRAADLSLMLRTFRRELANWMIRQDPERYYALFIEVGGDVAHVPLLRPEVQKQKWREIAQRYPEYARFDMIETLEHVTYADALSSYTFDEVAKTYRDIALFDALNKELDPNWKYTPPGTNKGDADRVGAYVEKIKTSRFARRLERAIGTYWAYRAGKSGPQELDGEDFSVQRVHAIIENRYGVHFKDTNERGLFTSFYDGGKSYDGYWRANEAWEPQGTVRPEIEE